MLKPCASHLHSRFLGQALRNARKHSAVKTKHSCVVLASLTNKGKQFSADSIAVNKIMGEGSYGQVFEVSTMSASRSISPVAHCSPLVVTQGALSCDSGTERVVLKRVKKRVQVWITDKLKISVSGMVIHAVNLLFVTLQGAEQMGQMEHLLNVYANKAAKGSIADFVGYIEVAEEQATTKLTQGVWLVSLYSTFSFDMLLPKTRFSSRSVLVSSLCSSHKKACNCQHYTDNMTASPK